ncbi:hypothetical protein CBM2599_A10050 [Cupriavidus taiwanensis]|nr:hypothetical protein CBM2599_A10050 [Cupriavidus taiwanensis]SOY87764.1 hypothetical protein CBM2600_A170050 [Cupriavidus taiwanensis]
MRAERAGVGGAGCAFGGGQQQRRARALLRAHMLARVVIRGIAHAAHEARHGGIRHIGQPGQFRGGIAREIAGEIQRELRQPALRWRQLVQLFADASDERFSGGLHGTSSALVRARGSKGLNDNVWRRAKRAAGAGLPDPLRVALNAAGRWHSCGIQVALTLALLAPRRH